MLFVELDLVVEIVVWVVVLGVIVPEQYSISSWQYPYGEQHGKCGSGQSESLKHSPSPQSWGVWTHLTPPTQQYGLSGGQKSSGQSSGKYRLPAKLTVILNET